MYIFKNSLTFRTKQQVLDFSFLITLHNTRDDKQTQNKPITRSKKSFGQLVLLGYDVTTFTPAAYQRRSLQRP